MEDLDPYLAIRETLEKHRQSAENSFECLTIELYQYASAFNAELKNLYQVTKYMDDLIIAYRFLNGFANSLIDQDAKKFKKAAVEES